MTQEVTLDISDDSTPALKTCPKCGREFPATLEFFSATVAGLRRDCKECVRRYIHEWQKANPEKRTAYHRRWVMTNPGKASQRDRAYRATHPEESTRRMRAWREANPGQALERQRAYRAANAKRLAERDRAYRAANAERLAASARAWALANPEKAAAAVHNYQARKKGNGGVHTAEDIQAQYERQKGRCYYCQKKVGKKYHVDHVIPLIKGGSNGPENLVIACPTCNQEKHDKHPMDYCGRLL